MVNKQIYLIRGSDEESYGDFKARIQALSYHLLEALHPEAIKFSLTEYLPPFFSLIPFSRKKMAGISVYSPSGQPLDVLNSIPGFAGGYQVSEALPVAYKVTWGMGNITPGVCLFTLFRKKKGLDYTKFIYRWHQIHTPHSLIIHPLWNYVRNVVDEKMDPTHENFDGIVEEQVERGKELLNPFLFWGKPSVMIPRMAKEFFDTKSFIDYSSMEVFLATEYLIKYPPKA
ncbi:MAG: hypothetical protein K2Q22_12590 [Cytophagales bacterium]|nr:hypothetical protein [Cytophagales bacterium]